jgi:hypothetical protein
MEGDEPGPDEQEKLYGIEQELDDICWEKEDEVLGALRVAQNNYVSKYLRYTNIEEIISLRQGSHWTPQTEANLMKFLESIKSNVLLYVDPTGQVPAVVGGPRVLNPGVDGTGPPRTGGYIYVFHESLPISMIRNAIKDSVNMAHCTRYGQQLKHDTKDPSKLFEITDGIGSWKRCGQFADVVELHGIMVLSTTMEWWQTHSPQIKVNKALMVLALSPSSSSIPTHSASLACHP